MNKCKYCQKAEKCPVYDAELKSGFMGVYKSVETDNNDIVLKCSEYLVQGAELIPSMLRSIICMLLITAVAYLGSYFIVSVIACIPVGFIHSTACKYDRKLAKWREQKRRMENDGNS